MNTLHVFYGLVWACSILGTVAVAFLVIRAYSVWAEEADLTTGKALAGIGLRVLAACAVLALLIGLPLDIVGY